MRLAERDSYEKDVFVHDSSSNERSFGGRMPEGRTGGDNCGSKRQWLSQLGQRTAESESSETGGTAAQDDERLADYHLLQGIVTGTNDEKGTFTLKADDGGEYVITTGNIGDVETEIADDSLVVIGYIGVEIHDNMDLEKVNMVIAAPGDDDWTIAYAEGTTTANAMSTFMMVTADGTEMGFMKDGCPMDEDALGGDSGAKIGVVYMDSGGCKFPAGDQEIAVKNINMGIFPGK